MASVGPQRHRGEKNINNNLWVFFLPEVRVYVSCILRNLETAYSANQVLLTFVFVRRRIRVVGDMKCLLHAVCSGSLRLTCGREESTKEKITEHL